MAQVDFIVISDENVICLGFTFFRFHQTHIQCGSDESGKITTENTEKGQVMLNKWEPSK